MRQPHRLPQRHPGVRVLQVQVRRHLRHQLQNLRLRVVLGAVPLGLVPHPALVSGLPQPPQAQQRLLRPASRSLTSLLLRAWLRGTRSLRPSRPRRGQRRQPLLVQPRVRQGPWQGGRGRGPHRALAQRLLPLLQRRAVRAQAAQRVRQLLPRRRLDSLLVTRTRRRALPVLGARPPLLQASAAAGDDPLSGPYPSSVRAVRLARPAPQHLDSTPSTPSFCASSFIPLLPTSALHVSCYRRNASEFTLTAPAMPHWLLLTFAWAPSM